MSKALQVFFILAFITGARAHAQTQDRTEGVADAAIQYAQFEILKINQYISSLDMQLYNLEQDYKLKSKTGSKAKAIALYSSAISVMSSSAALALSGSRGHKKHSKLLPLFFAVTLVSQTVSSAANTISLHQRNKLPASGAALNLLVAYDEIYSIEKYLDESEREVLEAVKNDLKDFVNSYAESEKRFSQEGFDTVLTSLAQNLSSLTSLLSLKFSGSSSKSFQASLMMSAASNFAVLLQEIDEPSTEILLKQIKKTRLNLQKLK